MLSLHTIFRDRVPQSAAGLVVLCIFVSAAVGPCLFAIRNKPSQSAIKVEYLSNQAKLHADWAARRRTNVPDSDSAAGIN